jgi:plasmid stabilization system protein ParE
MVLRGLFSVEFRYRTVLQPASGHASAELPETHRVYPVGSHVIVYRYSGHTLGIPKLARAQRRQQSDGRAF